MKGRQVLAIGRWVAKADGTELLEALFGFCEKGRSKLHLVLKAFFPE